ncbi:MAG TPA: hypothetical protein DCY25_03390 [Bacteroidales bacterium]|nr:hypothetical protein [Bacteroidales bacterium]
MKKLLLILAAVIFSSAIFAQGPDFSGSWKLNDSKSTLGAEFSMAPKEVIIAQTGNDMSVEKHSEFQGQAFVSADKLTLDGKECTNTAFQDMQKKSTCTWSDDKTSLKVVSKMSMGDGGDITINEVYKLDGDTLVIESTANSSYGDLTEKMVYEKKQ